MRILRVMSVILTVITVAVGAVFTVTSRSRNDAPTITCSEKETIVTTVGATDADLLTFVSAHDKQDGDISDRIKVIRKNFFADVAQKTTVVTFAVSDSDNNVTQIDRKLVFSDYHSPRVYFNNDFIFPSGYTYQLAKYITAEDIIDGDLTDYVKLISSSFTNIDGTYPINIKVSNSMGDTTDITVNAIVTSEDYFNLKVRLNNYVTYVTVGAEIDYAAEIKDIYNKKNDKVYKTADIKIDSSEVDTSTPGVYDAYYRIFDGDDVVTVTRYLVVVTEG